MAFLKIHFDWREAFDKFGLVTAIAGTALTLYRISLRKNLKLRLSVMGGGHNYMIMAVKRPGW